MWKIEMLMYIYGYMDIYSLSYVYTHLESLHKLICEAYGI
jgi:hypothetical protein